MGTGHISCLTLFGHLLLPCSHRLNRPLNTNCHKVKASPFPGWLLALESLHSCVYSFILSSHFISLWPHLLCPCPSWCVQCLVLVLLGRVSVAGVSCSASHCQPRQCPLLTCSSVAVAPHRLWYAGRGGRWPLGGTAGTQTECAGRRARPVRRSAGRDP